MPIPGPDGLLAYSPIEAYDAIGRHLFGRRWQRVYVRDKPIPHPPTAQRLMAHGKQARETQRTYGDPSTPEYALRQRTAYRTEKVGQTLQEMLVWGKTMAWRRSRDDAMEMLHPSQWNKGGKFCKELFEEIELVIVRNAIGSGRYLINKQGLDSYVSNEPTIQGDPEMGDAQPTRPGPKGMNVEALRTELWRCVNEELFDISRHFRFWTTVRRERESNSERDVYKSRSHLHDRSNSYLHHGDRSLVYH